MTVSFILLLAVLLSGCTFRDARPPVASLTGPTGPAARAEAAVTLRCGLPAHAPDAGDLREALPFGDGVLLVSEDGSLTALDSRLVKTGTIQPGTAHLQMLNDTLACYLPESREVLLLDRTLTEVNKIVLPPEAVGLPRLSQDGRRVWYCTENAIRVWDLDSGIRRRVKELRYDAQTVDALLLEDTVLACKITEGGQIHTLLLDAENGRQLHRLPGGAQILTRDQQYFAALPQSTRTDYVFGTAEGQTYTLLPEDLDAACTFLPQSNAAVVFGEDLEYYDLSTGLLTHRLSLPGIQDIKSILPFGEERFLLLVRDEEFACDLLLTWDLPVSQPDTTVYTGPYYTQENPNLTAMAGCQNYADQIGSKYGIQILVWEDAAAVQPWDYDLEPEHLERVLIAQLKALDQRLARYPEGMLSQTAAQFGGLNLCLVRQITGSAASGSLSAATGVQFLENGQAYVVLALGPYAEQALYHELFHVMETRIFAESTAFDHWETLNPAGFSYDYDFSANASRNSGVYLENSHRAFIDTYSMSYPKEDRARIFEYAMLPDCGYLFQTDVMQNKLQAVCTGLREAYDLKEGPYPWEQYLD